MNKILNIVTAHKEAEKLTDKKPYLFEDIMQADCFQWHWNTYPNERRMLYHVQQKAKNAVEGARFKALGVVRGPSDLVLIVYGMVIFIELKLPGKTQHEEQIDFERKCTERGHLYLIIRSFMAFKYFINKLYNHGIR
jgi:hypothetical protein